MMNKILKFISAEEAATHIHSGQRVFIHGAAMTPTPLVAAMCNRAEELREVEIVHIHTEGFAPYTEENCQKSFHTNA